MSTTTTHIIAVVSLIAAVTGLTFYLNQSPATTQTPQPATTEPSTATSTAADTTLTQTAVGIYTPYSEAALRASTAQHKILFFHATWCPTCNALNRDLLDSVADIPSDTAIFKTDYDTELALRQAHGVTLQHSFVLLNADGSTAKRWTNSRTLEEVLAER